jgi:hypothetical protein
VEHQFSLLLKQTVVFFAGLSTEYFPHIECIERGYWLSIIKLTIDSYETINKSRFKTTGMSQQTLLRLKKNIKQ